MSVIGENIMIIDSCDPTLKGRMGEIVLETSRTLMVLQRDGSKFRVEKHGTTVELLGSKKVLSGEEILGRLEDRLRMGKT